MKNPKYSQVICESSPEGLRLNNASDNPVAQSPHRNEVKIWP